MLRAHAHLLLAMALLWLKEFSRARRHLIVAYNSFARAGADEVSFALVETIESQRRSLSGEGGTALLLARRACKTFESYGMDDYAARATVTEGLAHCALDADEEAVSSYRSALPVFERHRLWSNYVGALNSAANSLTRLGRFDEARREYARALRRFSHEEHRYWLGYVRIGFAEALFAARRFGEAARAASQAGAVFGNAGLRAHQLIALLLEVESWARAGDLDAARGRLEFFRREVERDHALDAAVQRELVAALSGTNPDYENISSLRHLVTDLLEERYRA
jgi:tetratricopeptide (TPR) repeat protein